MQPPLTESEASVPMGLLLFLGVMILLPLVFMLTLYLTPLYVTLGGALGINLQSDPNLIVYDAVCSREIGGGQIQVAYWALDPAPMVVEYGRQESMVIESQAGVQSLTLTIKNPDFSCPDMVTLVDRSRNRRASTSIQVVE